MSQTPTNTLSNMGTDFTPTIHHDTYPYISPASIPFVPPGRSVFITGASKGIGAATALAYARAGFSRIAVGARSLPALAQLVPEIKDAAKKAGRAEPRVLVVGVDVTKRESVERAAGRVRAFLADGDGEVEDGVGGRRDGEKGDGDGEKRKLLDVVVANAGFLESFVPAAEVEDVDEWWRSYEVNVLGTFLTYRYFAPLLLGPAPPSSSSSSSSAEALNAATTGMAERNGEHADDTSLKTFLILSSIGAHNQLVGGSAYRSAKLALLRFAEHIAFEEQRRGLQVISIHPGGVPTELAWGMGEELGRQVLVDTPELAADTIVWLTRERRVWLNARYVSCNWDMRELEGKREEIVRGDLLKVRMAVEVGN
ncbi:Short chain dehydrogenase andI [Lasiodiplodia hormozganensis]|uniref:Short chain dehydrogenase andI n=1 Tax=Lasiodiplodia hormozganensis TaxID=869390 RepID=A0AA39WT51_9PEZI|nr:Short chain dehydrogenase andI [Lasiodiplodia hormozganensis]